MASGNINLRDPAMYRIRHATHHRTGDRWCLYPTVRLGARGLGCARERHAFPLHARIRGPQAALQLVQRALAEEWTDAENVRQPGLLQLPLPQQLEFARLNLTYVVLSKRS
jgi:glutaminyl-tRNA synthetase